MHRMIEQNKALLSITDYSVGQASLEQIFIAFAKQGERDQHAALVSMEGPSKFAIGPGPLLGSPHQPLRLTINA